MLDLLFKALSDQWSIVTTHYEVFIAAWGIGLVFGWTAAWLVLKQRLTHHRELIESYKDKLSNNELYSLKPALISSKIGVSKDGNTTDIKQKSNNQLDEKEPIEREFLSSSITIDYLTQFFKDHTNLQAQRLVDPYVGKWMRLSGIVNEVAEQSLLKNVLVVSLIIDSKPEESRPHPQEARFRDETQCKRVSILRRGEPISLIGKITYVSYYTVIFDFCEIVPSQTLP